MATINSSTRSDFYVYALFRENGVPFYIGKGRGNRWLAHEQESRKGVWGRKWAIIRDICSRGAVIKSKLHEGLTHGVAIEYERALIAAIGRYPHGPLANLTDGGDGGATGAKLSSETIAKRTAAQRGSKRSPEARANISAACLGRRHSLETIAKIRAIKIGTRPTPEAIAKAAMLARGKPLSSEHRANIAAGKRGKARSPETRAKISAAQLGKTLSPEHRANISAGLLARRS